MIAAHRTAHLTFGTDAVAGSLRATMTAAPALVQTSPFAQSAAGSPLDPQALYPHLFATPASRGGRLHHMFRAAAFRVSVVGSAALVMLTLVHHA